MDELLDTLGRHQRNALAETPGPPGTDALDAASREAMLDAVLAHLDPQDESEPPRHESPIPTPPADPTPHVASVVTLDPRTPASHGSANAPPTSADPSSPGRRAVRWLAPLAAAAMLLVWWRVRPNDAPSLDPLPDYALTLRHGGLTTTRSSASSDRLPTFHPKSPVDWVLTPSWSVTDSLAMAIQATSPTQTTVFVDRVDVQISADGAIRLRGRLDQFITLAPGPWTLTLFIASPDQLPAGPQQAKDPSTWRTVTLELMITAAP
ncbi:MAG: hypothetical protein AAGF11_06260 [Myxococcota bacterium]